MPVAVQIFVTSFYILWLISVLVLLVYMVVRGNKRIDRLENALIETTTKAHEVARTATDTAQSLVRKVSDAPKEGKP